MGETEQAVFQKDGTVLTVRPCGRLDAVTAPEFGKQFGEQLDEEITEIVMDLAQVDYIASAGLRVLLVSVQEMDERGGSMKLMHVREGIREIFELTGFLDFVTLE